MKKTEQKIQPSVDVNSIVHEVVEKIKTDKIGTEGVDQLDETGHKTTAGRPIDPESPRQKRLIEMEVKRQLGLLKRGRPVEPNSDRQQRLADREAKGDAKPGRPPMTEEEKEKAKKEREKRQKSYAADAAEKAKQILIKKGLMDEKGNLIPQTAGQETQA